MVEKRYVYRDRKPITWCQSCRTVLAEAEVEYSMATATSLWVWFDGGVDIAKRCGVADPIPCSLLVWTSSIWSLPGNAAVAVHPNFSYGCFVFRDNSGTSRAAVIQIDCAASAFQVLGVLEFTQIGTFKGSLLEGLQVKHPVFDCTVPVVLDEIIQVGSGSGLIHIAPAHGVDDFLIGRKYGLPLINLLDEDGLFSQDAGEFAGKKFPEAEQAILDRMIEKSSLATSTETLREQPHCWRCASPLITRVSEQWFVRIDHRETPDAMTLREKALLEIGIVNWLPASAQQRIRGMVETRPDWCISRQRFWGVPIPAFHCGECGEAILAPEAVREVRDLVGIHGSAIWFEKTAAELLPIGFRCPNCGGRKKIEKGTDTLDVWFEAGTSWQPMLVADHRLNFPADLYIEGSDQHRGWFQLSLLAALANRGVAPFRTVLTHGFVLNEKMHRMNRARGDLVTLQDTLERVPADIVRLYFASVDTSSDIPLSLKTFESITPLYRTFRNTLHYLLGNLFDFVAKRDLVHLEDLHPLDRWIFCRFHELIHKVSEDYSAYHFHVVVRHLHEFCNEDLSRLYFDILKDRLYCEVPSSRIRRSAQTVLHTILMGLVKLLAPLIPYTCDEVWTLTPGHSDCPSVHLSRWPKADEQFIHTKKSHETARTFSRWLELRRAVLPELETLRRNKIIGHNSEAKLRLQLAEGIDSFLGNATLADLRDFMMLSQVSVDLLENGIAIGSLPGVSFQVIASPHRSCARCRRLDATFGSVSGYPDLCARCAEVLKDREIISLATAAAEESISPAARPSDLAKFLIARDIRKIALLNEGNRCRAYALHAPSQEVRQMDELQSLADHISTSPNFRDHAAVLLGLGSHTDALFGVGIHHLGYGTPLGGTREFSYPRVRDLLDNLLRLSWGMSVKNAVAELPHGGGKSIIDTCGWDLKVHREFRREIYRDFGQFIASLFGRYICAEDVGNTTADTREMLYACRHVMCLSQGVSGSGNPSRFTALAAWAAAKAGWKFLTGTTSFDGLVVGLQGAGNVGRNILSILVEADPNIRKILIADRDPEQIQVIRNILLKRGKDELLEVLSSRDPRDDSPSSRAYQERDDEKDKEYILYAPCDILIPAAVGDVINTGNVSQLNCKLILPIANNVYSDNDTISSLITERDIVDVVENNVNWGGAMAAASEIFGYDEENVTNACLEAYAKTLNLLEDAKRRQCPPWNIVKADAFTRIFRSEHRIVSEARRYKFIGNISQGFLEWIKGKWLRNVVDVDPEEFAPYAVGKARVTFD